MYMYIYTHINTHIQREYIYKEYCYASLICGIGCSSGYG